MATSTVKLERMSIQAYEDENFSKKAGTPFEVMINPESYTRTNNISYTTRKKMGANSESLDFNKITKEKLNFKIVLDGSGVVPVSESNKGKDVEQMIKELKNLVYEYQGTTHQPHFVELLWGKLIFKGRLESLSFEYKIFKPDGTPLRAIVNLSFVQFMSEELATAKGGQSSPDMTHVVTIKEGDTLVALCRKIYGKSKYYLQVAEYNDLTNFRFLNPGSMVRFPPLK